MITAILDTQLDERAIQPDEASETWYDASGTGWDIEYVARYERMGALLQGTLICPWDAEYDRNRVLLTGTFDCWPAAIVICEAPEDTQACVEFAKKHDLHITIRDKGHATAKPAFVSGSLLVDICLL